MMEKILLFIVIIALILGPGCLEKDGGLMEESTPAARNSAVDLLDQVTLGIQDALSGIDTATSDASVSLGSVGISGPMAENILVQLETAHPAVFSAITIDPSGTVVSAKPWDVQGLVGQNLVYQEAVEKALITRKPLMSDLFPLAQGCSGVVIEYPVFSDNGTFSGVVSTAFVPSDLVAPLVENATEGTSCSFMVVSPDGRILYDPDPEEVGRDTLNETLYADFPEIFEVMSQLSVDPSGHATYSIYDTGFGKVVKKECYWSTAGLHGTEWRVMIISNI